MEHSDEYPQGAWPIPCGERVNHADNYTTMDVARLYLATATVLKRVKPEAIGPGTFELMLKSQGAKTLATSKTLGLADVDAFQRLADRLESEAQAAWPPPAWAADAKLVLWPFVFVAICEYSETVADPFVGQRGVQDRE